MTAPRISVVIPAYNAASTISRTLEAMAGQDYSKFEIVVVDDGSADNTVAVSEAFADTRPDIPFRVIRHDGNKGVSAARNTGLREARGDYVHFMDADDLADSNLLTVLHDAVSSADCDAAFCGLRHRYEPAGTEECKYRAPAGGTLPGEKMAALRLTGEVRPHLCSTLFRRDFLLSADLHFAEGCTAGEDVEFSVKAFSRATKVAFSSHCAFVYVIHRQMGSMREADTVEKRLKRYEHNTQAHFRLWEYLNEHAETKELSELANHFLLPLSYVRKLTLLARRGEYRQYRQVLCTGGVRSILWSSRKMFRKKPEVFGKCFLLLTAPDLFYRIRAKKK